MSEEELCPVCHEQVYKDEDYCYVNDKKIHVECEIYYDDED